MQSVERALQILEIVASHNKPTGIAEISKLSGLNRTTAWRLLLTLENCGFVEKDRLSKGYQLGFKASILCTDIREQYAPLIHISQPYMQELLEQYNEDILLTIPRFGGMLTIDQLHSNNAIMIRDYTMTLSPFHCSSNGKLFLGYLDEDELDIILAEHMSPVTAKTITDPDILRAAIRKARADGYGTSIEENGDGENGLSLPILMDETPYAFLNISGPSFRFTEDKMKECIPRTRQICREISLRISH